MMSPTEFLFFFSAIFLDTIYESCQYTPIEVYNYALVEPGYRHIPDVSFSECKKFCKSEKTCISVSFHGSLEADSNGCCALNGCGVKDERKLKDSLVFTPDCTFYQLRSTEAAIVGVCFLFLRFSRKFNCHLSLCALFHQQT